MHFRSTVFLCTCFSLILTTRLSGQTDPELLPEIPETRVIGQPDPFPATPLGQGDVVTPDRTETSLGTSGSSVTVLTEEQIRATGETYALEVLRNVMGLDVVQSGGPGRNATVFMRGANSNQTKVLLDGIPINDPSSPSRAFDFSFLTTENIQQIEIVRGPQSLTYGSDAIGGVINIITKRGEGPPRVRVGAQGGSFGTWQNDVNISGGGDLAYYSFGTSYFENEGFSAVSQRFGGFENDGYRNANFSGRYGITLGDALNVDYVFRYIDADSDIDNFLADNLIRQNRLNAFFNRVQVQSLAFDGLLENKFGFSLTDYQRLDTDSGFFGTPRFNGQTRVVDWQTNLLVMNNNTLMAGIDYQQEEASSTSLSMQEQSLAGVYVQDRFNFGDMSYTTVGVRWDNHSRAGQAQTYRFTQLFPIYATGTGIHGSIGRGFRAPTIDEIFGVVGNPDLQPEFSKGWDVGCRQQLIDDTLFFDVTYFRNDFNNLIVFDPTLPGPFGGALNNVQSAIASGMETTASCQLTRDMFVNASYTLTDTENLDTGAQLLRRPRNKMTLQVSKSFFDDLATVNLYTNFIGKRRDIDDLGGVTQLNNYTVVNVSGTCWLTDRWQLFVRGDNLTDADYEEVFGFATPGISGYAGLRFVQ
ncbi:MAG: TonB-dependent receptor [Pirellulaceae bacterium]